MLRTAPRIDLLPTVDAKILLVRKLGALIYRFRTLVNIATIEREMAQLDTELTQLEADYEEYANNLTVDRLHASSLRKQDA